MAYEHLLRGMHLNVSPLLINNYYVCSFVACARPASQRQEYRTTRIKKIKNINIYQDNIRLGKIKYIAIINDIFIGFNQEIR